MTTLRRRFSGNQLINLAIALFVLAGVTAAGFGHQFNRYNYADFLLVPILVAGTLAAADPYSAGGRFDPPVGDWVRQASLRFVVWFTEIGSYAALIWVATHWTAPGAGVTQLVVSGLLQTVLLATGLAGYRDLRFTTVIVFLGLGIFALTRAGQILHHAGILAIGLCLLWGAAIGLNWWLARKHDHRTAPVDN